MRITSSQLAVLQSFDCTRFSKDDGFLRMVDDFKNTRNENLVDYIQGDASTDDASGKTACYLVVDKDREILCYFALRSGLLYSEYEELRLYEQYKKLKGRLLELKESKQADKADILIQELSNRLRESKERIIRKLGSFDALPLHKQVSTSYPAIELSHFCVNEAYRDKWNAMGFGDRNRIGLTIFWHFVIGKVLEISELLGSEYLYLFAADSTVDRYLVNHYKNFMGFREDLDVLAIQPIYDFRCTFLCNKIEAMTEERKNFFENFNEEPI